MTFLFFGGGIHARQREGERFGFFPLRIFSRMGHMDARDRRRELCFFLYGILLKDFL